jgi:hypothetical protein
LALLFGKKPGGGMNTVDRNKEETMEERNE